MFVDSSSHIQSCTR